MVYHWAKAKCNMFIDSDPFFQRWRRLFSELSAWNENSSDKEICTQGKIPSLPQRYSQMSNTSKEKGIQT